MELCFVKEHDAWYRSHQEAIEALLPQVETFILTTCIYLSLQRRNKQESPDKAVAA